MIAALADAQIHAGSSGNRNPQMSLTRGQIALKPESDSALQPFEFPSMLGKSTKYEAACKERKTSEDESGKIAYAEESYPP